MPLVTHTQATLHLVILVLAMVLESYLRLNHRWRQQLGYLRFYRSTRHLLSVPFYGAALATAALLLAELWPEAARWLPQHTKLVVPSPGLQMKHDASPSSPLSELLMLN